MFYTKIQVTASCFVGNQKSGRTTALRGHLLGTHTVLNTRYVPAIPEPKGRVADCK